MIRRAIRSLFPGSLVTTCCPTKINPRLGLGYGKVLKFLFWRRGRSRSRRSAVFQTPYNEAPPTIRLVCPRHCKSPLLLQSNKKALHDLTTKDESAGLQKEPEMLLALADMENPHFSATLDRPSTNQAAYRLKTNATGRRPSNHAAR